MRTNKYQVRSALFRSIRTKKLLAVVLVFAALVLLLGMTPETLGRFSRSFFLADSAAAAKFDVEVLAPEEFWFAQNEAMFEYYFLSPADEQELIFRIINRGEIDVRCRPQMSGGIVYRMFVGGEAGTDFIVGAKTAMDFRIVIIADGLDTSIRSVELFIDIEQTEGRRSLW